MADIELIGLKMILYGEKNGVMIPVCGARSCSLTITADINEATKPPNSVWKSNYYGKLSYKISCSGMCIINSAKFTHRDVMMAQIQRQSLQWVMESRDSRDEFYSGFVLIDSFEDDADMSDMQLFTFSGTGDGAITVENPYSTYLIGGSASGNIIGDGSTVIGWNETGDLPPINRNC